LSDQARLNIVAAAGFGGHETYRAHRIRLRSSHARVEYQDAACDQLEKDYNQPNGWAVHRSTAALFLSTRGGAQQSHDFCCDVASLRCAFLIGFPCRRILLVHERYGVFRAERLALCFRERREWLMNENDCGYALLPCLECVAHGGAGAGASGADTDNHVIDGFRERTEFGALERHPRITFVCALHRRGRRKLFERALQARPELPCRLVLIPYESHAPADGRVQGAALGLLLDTRITHRADELDHKTSKYHSGKLIFLVSMGSPAELRLEMAMH
jgi:hypothetical protein